MELGTMISGALATLDLVKVAAKARDEARVEAATQEIRERLVNISALALTLVEKNASLIATNAELKAANAEHKRLHLELEDTLRQRAQYELCEIQPGTFAYRSKPVKEGEPAIPPHYLCQPCYDKGTKVVLQLAPNRGFWMCPDSKDHMLRTGEPVGPPVISRKVVSRGPFGG